MASGLVAADIVARLRPLSVEANRAAWDVNVDAGPATRQRREATEAALSDVLGDPSAFRRVEEARAAVDEPTEARQLDLLRDDMLPHQASEGLRHRIVALEASVESRFVTHRGVVAGAEVTDNQIKRILQASDDVTERREAWEASKTVGAAVAGDVRELARLRNEAARGVGYRDWFALTVGTTEMSETRLLSTLDEIERVTAAPFARWKAVLDDDLARRFGCTPRQLRPWHYADPFFQEVPAEGGVDLDGVFAGRDLVELTRRTFDGLGLETAPVLDRSDLFPRDRKSQHAFCLDVDREGDVRVLCNVVPDTRWMETMLHELGHAVFSEGHDSALPWLLRDCHLTSTEGVAILMGRLARDPEWLVAVAGLSAAEAAELAPRLAATLAADHLVFARWVLVMTSFERSLYANPDGDLDARWWELVAQYQLVTPPEGRAAPDWAAKIHVACAPVYYHTYLYGSITAAQLTFHLERLVGGLVDRPAAGALLAERVFAPGMSLRWDDLLERAVGEPLSASHYGREIVEGLGI